MGGHQVKICMNCKFSSLVISKYPCRECLGHPSIYPNWKSKRGRKAGSKSQPGTKKTGPIPKPSGEKMCFPVLSIKGKDLEAYGGIETLKADVKLMVETKLK